MDVQEAYGRTMVERSLGTSDKREARKREAILTARLEETWDALRGQGSDLQRWQAGVEWLAEQKQLDLDDEGAWAGASAAYDALIEGKAKLPTPTIPSPHRANALSIIVISNFGIRQT